MTEAHSDVYPAHAKSSGRVDFHRCDSGVVMTEYVLVLSLISLGTIASISPLIYVLVRTYNYIVQWIDLPLPLT